MDANQRSRSNPFGMDEACRNCPALCETRTQVVHGYGDVAADFLFVGEGPTRDADRVGVPLAADESGGLRRVLERLGLCDSTSPVDQPGLVNAYLTNLTRCHHPERPPSDEEVRTCDPYIEAEIRMINPEVIVPIGERVLTTLAVEHTTRSADSFDVETHHGERIRGRGFELVPMIEPGKQTDEETQAWVEAFAALMATDYRQTKGRQKR